MKTNKQTKTDNHPLEAVLALSALVEYFYKTTRNSVGRQSYNNAYRVIAAKLGDRWSASTICNVRQEYNGYSPGPALAAAILALHDTMFHVKHTKKPKTPPKPRDRRWMLEWGTKKDKERVKKLGVKLAADILLAAAIERGY